MTYPSDFEKVKSYSDVRSELASAEATKRGCVVVVPGPKELFIDIDSAAQMRTFEEVLPIFQRTHRVVRTDVRPSPSGEADHFHIVVRLADAIDAKTRILYQSVLGSDPMREVLSVNRLECGDATPTLFFERG